MKEKKPNLKDVAPDPLEYIKSLELQLMEQKVDIALLRCKIDKTPLSEITYLEKRIDYFYESIERLVYMFYGVILSLEEIQTTIHKVLSLLSFGLIGKIYVYGLCTFLSIYCCLKSVTVGRRRLKNDK